MKKLAKIKLSAELLESAADSVRIAALDKIRWNDKCHLELEDRWSDAELLSKLTPAGDEILEVAEELAFKLEGLI
jgi:hypothetical protein